jgi:hypothetical protein
MPADLQKEEAQKTFYLETFGCQMNVHDSEKAGWPTFRGFRNVGFHHSMFWTADLFSVRSSK